MSYWDGRWAVCTVQSFICLSDTEDRVRTITGSADLQHLVWVRAIQSTPSCRNPPGEKDVSSSIPLRYPPLIFWSANKTKSKKSKRWKCCTKDFSSHLQGQFEHKFTERGQRVSEIDGVTQHNPNKPSPEGHMKMSNSCHGHETWTYYSAYDVTLYTSPLSSLSPLSQTSHYILR